MNWISLLIIILIICVTIYLFMIAPKLQGKKVMHPFLKFHFAHRGLHNKDLTVPENSIAAFKAAMEKGYGMELDVTLTADEHLVVFHDETLKRVCNKDADIKSLMWDTVKEMHLHQTNETIPLFSDVLKLIDGKVPLIIELKPTKRYEILCAKTMQLLEAYKGLYCVESFDPFIVRWFKTHHPRVIRGQLSAGTATFKNTPRLQRFLLGHLMTNFLTRPHFVAYRHEDSRHHIGLRMIRQMGGALVAYTVTDEDDHDYCFNFFDCVIFEGFMPQRNAMKKLLL